MSSTEAAFTEPLPGARVRPMHQALHHAGVPCVRPAKEQLLVLNALPALAFTASQAPRATEHSRLTVLPSAPLDCGLAVGEVIHEDHVDVR